MMQKFSYHTHTNSFGVYDGHNSAAEMIAAAEAAGYTELGISNHLICKKGISRFTPQFFDDFKIAETVYLKTIDEIRTAAQKYKIKVLSTSIVCIFCNSPASFFSIFSCFACPQAVNVNKRANDRSAAIIRFIICPPVQYTLSSLPERRRQQCFPAHLLKPLHRRQQWHCRLW